MMTATITATVTVQLTVVLDAVGVDEADVRQERIAVLIFVLRDILWIH